MARLDYASLLHLIGLTHDAAQEPAAWTGYLAALTSHLNARSALMVRHDLRGQGLVLDNTGVDPEALAQYNAHFHTVDVWAISAKPYAGAGHALADESLVARSELVKTEFHADFARRFDTSRMATLTLGFDDHQSALSLHRRERDRPFSARELSFLEALLPHVASALRVQARLSALTDERDALATGLDALAFAVVLTDAGARVLYCNRKGAGLRVAGDGIGVSGGRLVASTAAGTQRLRELCASAAAAGSAVDLSGGALTIPRPGLAGPPLQVLVAPARRDAVLSALARAGTAVVFIHDPMADHPPREELLRFFYGLTRGEAFVAARLALGRSIEEIALERGVTVETVRWYVKQVLAKTGARNRAEFVRLVARSLASLDGATQREDSGR